MAVTARPTIPIPQWACDEVRHLLAQELEVNYHASDDVILEVLELQFARGLVTPNSMVLWMQLVWYRGYLAASGVKA